MKIFKEIGLIVLGILVATTIIYFINFNARLRNLENITGQVVNAINQNQRQAQRTPMPQN